MKILIAYAGKYGSTEKCAVQLSKLLNADITIANLTEQFNGLSLIHIFRDNLQ